MNITVETFLNQIIPSLERYIGGAMPKNSSDIEKPEWQNLQRAYAKNKFYADFELKKQLDKDISNLALDFCLLENFVPKKSEKNEFLFESALKRKQYYEQVDKVLSKSVDIKKVCFFSKEDLSILPYYNTAEFQYQFQFIIDQSNKKDK